MAWPTPILVWPHTKGSVRGLAVAPLYPSVPEAALKGAHMYVALAA